MLSRSLRQRLGDLIREGEPAHRVPPYPNSPDTDGGERRMEPAGIEEVLSGGVLEGPHGSLFIHERLYTDLGERPLPLLEKLSALSESGSANGCSGNGWGGPAPGAAAAACSTWRRSRRRSTRRSAASSGDTATGECSSSTLKRAASRRRRSSWRT